MVKTRAVGQWTSTISRKALVSVSSDDETVELPVSETTRELCLYKRKNIAVDSSDEDTDSEDDVSSSGGGSNYCKLCKVWYSSSVVADQHRQGRRHSKALRLYGALNCRRQMCLTDKNSPINRWRVLHQEALICDVCFMEVNTEEQLRLHRQSPAHLKKAKHASWSSIISQGGVPGDYTEWKKCHECGKRVNSEDQLVAHMRSHDVGLRSIEYPTRTTPKAVACASRTDGKKKSKSEDRCSRRRKTHSSDWESSDECPSKKKKKKLQLEIDLSEDESSPDEFQLSDSDSSVERPSEKKLKLKLESASSEDESSVDESSSKTLNLKTSTKHQPSTLPFGPQYRFHCPLCMVPFNTIQAKLEHERGKQHVTNVARKMKAPVRNLPDVKTSSRACFEGGDGSVTTLTRTEPRPYQIELYEAAMKNDCVCFLPTGTGKTLVSVMVISRMLQLNPHHSVVFLVDKVLLALQQAKVIRDELGRKTFTRWDRTKNSASTRRLRIAMLCGQKEDLKDFELWEHDVIVVTAAYYSNLLDKETVRWSDNCVAVFDEVHHCHDEHPYRKLLQQTRHARLTSGKRPKLLGLTASPAGKETISATEVSLRRLLKDFGCGETKLIRVSRNKDDLAKYQSSAELKIIEVEFSVEELALRSELERCMKTGCQRVLERSAPLSTTDGDRENTAYGCDGLEFLLRSLGKSTNTSLVENGVRSSEDHLDSQTIEILTESVKHSGEMGAIASSSDKVEFIRHYIHVVGRSLISLSAEGIDSALRDLDDLAAADPDAEDGGISAKRMVPESNRQKQVDEICRQLELPGVGIMRQTICRISSIGSTYERRHTVIERRDIDQVGDNGMRQSAVFIRLVVELVQWWDAKGPRDNGHRIALVLVRERGTARSISSLLDRSNRLRRRRMRVAHLVGHGGSGGGKRGSDDKCAAASGRDGMTVARQSRVIKEIWNGEYNVVVATSVAEEGIDLPECDLVVRLDVPDCLRALVQVRGRARRRGGKFVVFCRENKQILERLLKQEENMMQAVDRIVQKQQRDED